MRTSTTHAARALALASLIAAGGLVAGGGPAAATTCGPTVLPTPDGVTGGGVIWMTDDGRYVGGVGGDENGTAAWWDGDGVHTVDTGLVGSVLLDVNESGLAVGLGFDEAAGVQRGFLYSLGADHVQLLPNLGGDIQPRRINEDGVVSGGAGVGPHSAAAAWFPPYTEVTRLARAALDSYAGGVSDTGVFVGDAGREVITPSWRDYGGAEPATHDREPVPLQWRGTAKPTVLERHGPGAVASAVNADGLVVGSADFDEYQETRAAVWIDGQLRDLGTLPGAVFATAVGVSDGGWATGEVERYNPDTDEGSWHAFVWLGPDSGDLRPLPSLLGDWDAALSLAHGVNDLRDEVAGTAWDADGNPLPTVWRCVAEITS
jgi:probable HAF family extracellular repeat protein